MILSGNCFRNQLIIYTYVVVFIVVSKLSFASGHDPERFKSASMLINNGQYLEAIGIYNEISKDSDSDNNRVRSLLFSGTVYDLYLDQPVVSLKIFKEIFENYPDSSASSDALFNSGRILYKMEKYKESYDIFRVYMSKYPENMRRASAKIRAS